MQNVEKSIGRDMSILSSKKRLLNKQKTNQTIEQISPLG